MWSGAYEKHLRTAHANLDIVLASTAWYKSLMHIIDKEETSILHHWAASELRDCDYQWDLDPTWPGLYAFSAHQADTEIPVLGTPLPEGWEGQVTLP